MGPASTVIGIIAAVIGGLVLLGILYAVVRLIVGWTYRVPRQGQALVRTGMSGIKVATTGGIFVMPIVHRLEIMDISLKEVTIHRHGSTGLICRDNLRADIQVTFYVRVESEDEGMIKHVAQTIGCERGSDPEVLSELFEPKFSDALKTAGREFNFEDLLNKRKAFRDAVLKAVGTDLNGYILDDAAIDLLEQTKVEMLDPDNVLDAEGIKRITERTSAQAVLTNEFERNKERDINKKNVETREMILEQNRQLAEAEEKQKREVAGIKAREEAETIRIQQEERLKAEKSRIASDEEINVSEQNKDRQIIVAMRNKERTDGVEQVRVRKDRELEDIEREKVVTLNDIAKRKAVETEKKNIQEVIRDRVMLQKEVVAEEQRIKDTEEFATADREKRVAITLAEAEAEQELVKEVKKAEADRKAAELIAQKKVVEAQGEQDASVRIAEGKKALAEGITAETAAPGLADAQVLEAKAVATEKQGTAEATVMNRKFDADADGITKKAAAMKLFNEAGKEHEEFKIRANIEKDVALAEINIRKNIAESQAMVVAEALKHAKVDIVGGETAFFDKIIGAITAGKSVDRTVGNSDVLANIKDTFFRSDPEYFRGQIRRWTEQFGVTTEDIRNLTVAAAIAKLTGMADAEDVRKGLETLSEHAERAGLGSRKVGEFLGGEDR